MKIFEYQRSQNRIMLICSAIILIGFIAVPLLGDPDINTELQTKRMISICIVLCLIAVCLLLSRSSIAKILKRRKNVGIALDKIEFQPKYRTISLEEEKCRSYVNIIEYTFSTTKIYLRPGLSLDELSAITNIPRHHLSNLLNVHIGKTFYQYISEYRIQEAISRIENDDNLTVESLSYECGFNSKTSFNRYFKNATGSTPSEYRKVKMMSD